MDPFFGLPSPSEEDQSVEGGFAIIDYPEGDSTEETPSPSSDDSQSEEPVEGRKKRTNSGGKGRKTSKVKVEPVVE